MKMLKNNTYLISGLILISLVTTFTLWHTKNTTKVVPQNTLRVGMMSGWAPFMTLGTSGNYEGFDVDVAQVIAQSLGKKLELIDLGSLPALLLALEQGRIDCAMSGLDITTERLQRWDMIPYYGSGFDSFYLLFWQTIPKNVVTINDFVQNMPNAIIAVEPGSASEKFLDSFSAFKQKKLASVADMIIDVRYGRSTAAIVEPLIAQRLLKQMPELKALIIPISQEFQVYGMGIALRKNNPLKPQIQKVLAQLKSNNTITNYAQRWELTGGANDER